MLAIHTKYLPPTNNKGSRIKAFVNTPKDREEWQIIVPLDYALRKEDAHFEAVKALVDKYKLNWDISNMRYGDSCDGKGYSFCFDESKIENEVKP